MSAGSRKDTQMLARVQMTKDQVLADVCLVSAEELAAAVGFKSCTDAFRGWCRDCGIHPVPGRRTHFDPKHVRRRLDALQGQEIVKADTPVSLVAERRARRGSR